MELKPKQQTFLKYFLDPKSETWGNYLQSALKAGYDEDYARNMRNQMPDWLASSLDKTRLVVKAEKNLEIALEGGLDDPEKGKREIQYKATEFTLKALRKQDYSERVEHTGADGKELQINIVKYDNPTTQVQT